MQRSPSHANHGHLRAALHSGWRLALSGVVSALVLASCGTSSNAEHGPGNGEAAKSGATVSQDAAAALQKAGAVHLSGSLGNPTTGTSSPVDLHMQINGTTGTFTVVGLNVDIVRPGSNTYVRGSAAYYEKGKLSAAVAQRLAGKWVRVPANEELATEFRFEDLVNSFTHPGGGASIDAAVKRASWRGMPVVVVSQSDESQLYVAAIGTPYPPRIISAASSGRGDATMSDFGKQVSIHAPAGAIDLPRTASG